MNWRGLGIGLATTLCVGLAGCGKAAKAVDAAPSATGPGPEALVMPLVTTEADLELNAPVVALHDLLNQASSDGMIYTDELLLADEEGATTPADWWFSNQGYIAPAGADDAGRAYFKLSPKGTAFVTAPAPVWFKTAVSGKPTVDCRSSGTVTGAACQVSADLTVATTPPAAKGVALGNQTIQTRADFDPTNKWRVSPLRLAGDAPLSGAARMALLGDADAQTKSRQDWITAINDQFARLAQGGNPAAADPTASTSHPSGPFTTSFDCQQANTDVEATICGNAQLAALDVRMADAYRRALAVSADPGAIRRDQRDWLRVRRDTGTDIEALRELYREHIDALNSISDR